MRSKLIAVAIAAGLGISSFTVVAAPAQTQHKTHKKAQTSTAATPAASNTEIELLKAQLAALQAKAPCRLDIQVDTGAGGFALAEYVRGGRVMLKTAHGPVLVADPWRSREAA